MLKASSNSLQEFYLDFDNVCQGETYQENLFFEKDNEDGLEIQDFKTNKAAIIKTI